MKKPVILFIQGGGEGAYEIDKLLVLFLKDTLREAYDINYPEMPKENDPDYELWKSEIDKELTKIDRKVILMGHSVGAYVLLKYLSNVKIEKDFAGIFLIAPPFLGAGGWQYEGMELAKDFASKLPSGVPVFFYHGTADESVPFKHLTLYSRKLPNATFRKVTGGGHQLNNDLSTVVQDIRNLV